MRTGVIDFKGQQLGLLVNYPLSPLKKVYEAHSHGCRTHIKKIQKVDILGLVKRCHDITRELSSLCLAAPPSLACSFLLMARDDEWGPAIMSEFQQIGRNKRWKSRRPPPFEDICPRESCTTLMLTSHGPALLMTPSSCRGGLEMYF